MKPSRRKYSMSDSELAQLASDYIVYMTRDATEFDARGVDAATVTAFETLGNAFEVFPTDEEYLGLLMIEVDAKNQFREDCTGDVQFLSGFLEQKWGLESGQYKRLGIDRLQILRDREFLYRCREVVRITTEYLTDLTPEGLTQTMIDTLETNAQSLEDKLNAIADKTALRDAKAAERIRKGNELYDYLRKYSTIGKLIWENVDESKYNDYIIYPTVHHGLGKVLNLTAEYSATPTPAITLAWDAVENATKYSVYQSTVPLGDPPDVWAFINDFTGTGETFDVLEDTRYWWYVQAKNDTETGPPSDEVYADTVEE